MYTNTLFKVTLIIELRILVNVIIKYLINKIGYNL